MRRLFILILVAAFVLGACAPQTTPPPTANSVTVPQTLTVFAAASLGDAFREIGKNFETNHPGLAISFNFGGSQTLRTQIEQGAQADVFASANTKEMDALVKDALVGAGTAKLFLENQLVVILPANNPAGLTTLEDLAKPGLKLILAAKEVPAGNYSLQILDKLDQALGADYKDKVLTNVASYENDVKQVVAKVQLGEADAGIVYVSDAVAAPGLQKIIIPAANNVIAQYPIAVLANSLNQNLARAFVDYVLSPDGQAVLQKWGFLPLQ